MQRHTGQSYIPYISFHLPIGAGNHVRGYGPIPLATTTQESG